MDSDVNLIASFASFDDYFNNVNSDDVIDHIMILFKDCAGKNLINNVKQKFGKITIRKSTTLLGMAAFMRNDDEIHWNMNGFSESTKLIFLHELFHAFQHGVGYLEDTGTNINVEVEAFLAMYKYANKHGIKYLLPGGTIDEWNDTFGAYLNNPDATRYNLMVTFIRNTGLYPEDFYPNIQSKANTNNVNTIFNCY